ncbi:hypothetical protein ['Camptotheca acuminata' phytoplasma]|uniref:hypothetical protein n=1 Tax='Camptotheca acuminata' phytoplasma TaxID=3239192 RepID=UPI00351A9EA1
MVNEANTTHLVRNKLREMSYYDDNSNIIIEEQKSNSPKINKLLQHAFKQGKGVGKPDFIIRHQDKQDYIIIIECKSSPLYHESKERNKYQNYAVDINLNS